jgi:hypothetical protein
MLTEASITKHWRIVSVDRMDLMRMAIHVGFNHCDPHCCVLLFIFPITPFQETKFRLLRDIDIPKYFNDNHIAKHWKPNILEMAYNWKAMIF